MKTTVHDHSLELLHSTTIRISGELSSGMQWRMNAGLDFNDEKVINKCYPMVARHHERASLLTERSHCGAPRGAGGCAVLMGKV